MSTKFNFLTALTITSIAMLYAVSSHAGVASPCDVVTNSSQSSWVESNTIDNGGGSFSYNFTVCNTSDPEIGDLIRDWELPWDPDAAAVITDIRVPDGWAWSIETEGVNNFDTGWEGVIEWQEPGDPFAGLGFQDHNQVLHFYTACPQFEETASFTSSAVDEGLSCFDLPADWIFPGDRRDGFGFTAAFGPTAAPYQASWVRQPVNTGDPDFPFTFQGAPGAFTPQFVQQNLPGTPIPEPSSIALMCLALLLAGNARRMLNKRDI